MTARKITNAKEINISIMYIETAHYEEMLHALLDMYIFVDYDKGILWAIETLLFHWSYYNTNTIIWERNE